MIQMRITLISKDGYMTVRLSGKAGVGAVTEAVKNETFTMRMMT